MDVLTDADEKGVLPNTISILLADWIIENLIAPGTDEAPEEVRGRLSVRGQSSLEFLLAVLTDADTNGALPDAISVLLADWIIENFIAPGTGETPQQVGERLGGQAEDRAALIALYETTDGANWSTSTNWLSDRPLDKWHGVRTDSHGRVIGLRLSENRLSGRIPTELGRLVNLQELALHSNELSGLIPPELGSLASLERLFLGGNQLSGCIPSSLVDVVFNDLGELGLPFCAATTETDRDALVALYEATGGVHWEDSANWLSDRPLGEWYGVTTDAGGRVVELELGWNQLSGHIPPELGKLTNLRSLWIHDNQLIGAIPPELGNLSNLQWLFISGSRLSGCIPDGLGDVAFNDLDELGLPFCVQ